MGTKIKCLQCGDIIEGDGNGHFISCSCGKCYVDETQYYTRIGGDPEQMMTVDNEGNEKPMIYRENELEKELSKQQSKIIYIFLDVDGVLNDEEYIEECWQKNGNKPMHMNHVPFDPKCLNNLMILCQKLEENKYDVRLILSSTWRLHDIDYAIVDARLAEYGLSLSDKTLYLSGERGQEIEQYINNNEMCRDFIIIDDDKFDIEDLFSDNLISTKFKTGFDDKALNKAINYFKERGILNGESSN